MGRLVDLSGAPLGAANLRLVDVAPGYGGKLTFTETSEVDFPGSGIRARFAPGQYLLMHVSDFERMTGGTPGPTEGAKLAADA